MNNIKDGIAKPFIVFLMKCKMEQNNLNSSVGWRNNKSGKWEIYQENEIINPTNNFDIIVFKPGYGSIIKSFN